MNDQPEPPPADDLVEEARRSFTDPWLPAETWLVAGSLALGAALLGLLLWVSETYFATR